MQTSARPMTPVAARPVVGTPVPARPSPTPPLAATKPAAASASAGLPWIRIAAVTALVAGIVGFLGDAYHIYWGFALDADRSELLESPLYRAHGIAIAVAYAFALLSLPGIAAAGTRGAKAPLAIGIVLAFVGTVLVAGDYWAESAVTPGVVADEPGLADGDAVGLHLAFVIGAFALHALGWLLVAIGAGRSGAPKWLAVLLGVGAVVAFTPLPGSNLLLFLAILFAFPWLKRAGATSRRLG